MSLRTKKVAISTLTFFSLGSSFPALALASENKNTITTNATFTVGELKDIPTPQFPKGVMHIIPIPKARVIIIDNHTGHVLATGLTNNEGKWTPKLTIRSDPRFLHIGSQYVGMGTTTVMVTAKGYNELIQYEVPIHPLGGALLYLCPINGPCRNEPHFQLGGPPRWAQLPMVDYYASKVGLKRQTPNTWGPDLAR